MRGANAWAQSDAAAAPANYARTVRLDAALHQALVERAGERGHEVGRYELMPVVAWLEVRLLSLGLRPGAHPLPRDTRAEVLGQALRAAWCADGVTPTGRLAWCVWFVALAVLPVAAVRAVVQQGRTQPRRSGLARLVM